MLNSGRVFQRFYTHCKFLPAGMQQTNMCSLLGRLQLIMFVEAGPHRRLLFQNSKPHVVWVAGSVNHG